LRRGQLDVVACYLRRLAGWSATENGTDAQLLERFVSNGDEDAFATLVHRYGRLVRSVCRHVLRHEQDVDDAFQVTFLVLASKAATIWKTNSVASWLYGVAYRSAMNAKKAKARRREQQTDLERCSREQPLAETSLREIQAILHDEVNALPGKYRAPFVLCCLEGKSRAEAAKELGSKEGTVSSRLARARQALQRRLSRRGVLISAALSAVEVSRNAVAAAFEPSFIDCTTKAALSFATGKTVAADLVSADVAALAKGVLQSLFMSKVKIAIVLLLGFGLLAEASLLGLRSQESEVKNQESGVRGRESEVRDQRSEVRSQFSRTEPPAVRESAEPPQGDEIPPAQEDRLGDRLPPGAVARMGSSRLRHLTHSAYLLSEVSPDSKTLLTMSERGIRAWSMGTGKLLYQIKDELYVHRVAFSPDSKWLAVTEKAVVALYDPGTGRKLRQIPAGGLLPRQPELVAFSGDGRQLAVGLREGEILIFDTATGKQTASLDAQGAGKLRSFYFLVFGANGQSLLSIGRDSDSRESICHWDLATQTLRKRVVPAYGARPTVALSPDGRLLAVPTRSTVNIWDTETGEVRSTLQGERSRVWYGLAFSPDSKTLVTAWADDDERDAVASFWDTATGKPAATPTRFRVSLAAMQDLHYSPDGRRLIIPGGCFVRVWDIEKGQEVLQQDAHVYGVTCLAFTPDGQSIISGGGATPSPPIGINCSTIHVWDAKTGQQRQVMVAHRWSTYHVKVRPDGRTIVSCGADGSVRMYDLTTGKELRRGLLDQEPDAMREMKHQILQMELSPDGRTATTLCSGPSSLLHTWDLDSGRILFHRPHTGQVHSCIFTPDARMLVSTHYVEDLGGDGAAMRSDTLPKGWEKMKAPPRTVVVLEEVTTGRELLTLPQPGKSSQVLALTPDGQCILTSTFAPEPRPVFQGPSTLRLWELATGKQRLAITSARGGYDHDFARMAVAPDGRTLATVRSDYIIQLWDLATGKELLRRPGHDAPTYCMAFSPDGKRLATGHGDSQILVWDVAEAYKRRPRPDVAGARELEGWWKDLAVDAPRAHRAIWSLVDVPAQAVSLLRDRLRPAVALPADEFQRLVQELDSPNFRRREEASRRLTEFGEEAEPTLRQALADKPSAETRRRLEQILSGPRPIPSPDLLRSLRSVQILEAIGDDPARGVLGTLVKGAPASPLTREARAALERLAHR
jgi:RNA polymerase sigma factor (sigma-70 family)